MYAQTSSSNHEVSDIRLSVADILSSMANGTSDTVVTTTLSNMGGLTSGIPTRTTPTLTPTTLKNIEESFLELQSIPPAPLEHQHQAGFVPPVVNIAQYQTNPGIAVKQEVVDEDWMPSCVQMTNSVQQVASPPIAPTTKSSRSGGRRPARESNLSPEEEERRRVRRERNKLAAARCRKRRLDHTNRLVQETEGLEDKRQALQNEIQALKSQKEELEFLLEAHKATCKMIQNKVSESRKPARMKITARPNSLPVSSAYVNSDGSSALKLPSTTAVITEVAGIPIQTPSSGIFTLESLIEGTGMTPVSTGLTPTISTNMTPLTTPVSTYAPIITSCSGQQRSSGSDLSSPDSINPPKLVSL